MYLFVTIVLSLTGKGSKSVVIHQLSKRRSQSPFKNSKGLVQCVQFHPTKPFFFVAVSFQSMFIFLYLDNYASRHLNIDVGINASIDSCTFLQTQRYVRVYNLTKQELAKKLTTGIFAIFFLHLIWFIALEIQKFPLWKWCIRENLTYFLGVKWISSMDIHPQGNFVVDMCIPLDADHYRCW